MIVKLIAQYIDVNVGVASLREVETIPLHLHDVDGHLAHAFKKGAMKVIVVPVVKE